MLHNLGWQSLDSRRQDQRLFLFYKIINRLASVETEDILTPADSRTRKNHSFKFKHLQANCYSYRFSFFPATISSWNNLPFGIEKIDSVCRVLIFNDYLYYIIQFILLSSMDHISITSTLIDIFFHIIHCIRHSFIMFPLWNYGPTLQPGYSTSYNVAQIITSFISILPGTY